jgi:hypothetical protein
LTPEAGVGELLTLLLEWTPSVFLCAFFACLLRERNWSNGGFPSSLRSRSTVRIVSLGLFNSALMNDAVYKFKRYEDASLTYTGINKHEGEDVGLYDTVITRKDAEKVFENIPARARSGLWQPDRRPS